MNCKNCKILKSIEELKIIIDTENTYLIECLEKIVSVFEELDKYTSEKFD